MAEPPARAPRGPLSLKLQTLLVLLAAAIVALPLLGRHGLRSTEGHRVIPATEALETGEPLPTRMFERAYVRKPPGMPWSIAVSIALLGETEFAMRLPSALAHLAMCLVAFGFATRWFGSPFGLAAGIVTAITPRLWFSARTAEIEHLNFLGAQIAALAIIDLLMVARTARARLWMTALVAFGVFLLAFYKGPSALPVVPAAMLGACLTRRSWRPLRVPWPWIGAALGALGFGIVLLAMARALGDEFAVTSNPTPVMLVPANILKAPEFLAVILLGSVPLTIPLLFPFGPLAHAETAHLDPDHPEARAHAVARACGWAFLITLGIYLLLLVGNPRYGLPALVLAGPVASYVVRGAAGAPNRAQLKLPKAAMLGRRIAWPLMMVRWLGGVVADPVPGRFGPLRRFLARVAMLGHPAIWPIVMGIVLAWWLLSFEPGRGADSGRTPGRDLAAALVDHPAAGSASEDRPLELWADGLIEARPETLFYFERAARASELATRVRWMPRKVQAAELPPPGVLLVLREAELSAYRSAHPDRTFTVLHEGRVHEFEFAVVRVE